MGKTKYYLRNAGKTWSDEDISKLKTLAKQDTPTGVIGLKLGRSKDAVYAKASEEEISLMPPNPSHRRKKPI